MFTNSHGYDTQSYHSLDVDIYLKLHFHHHLKRLRIFAIDGPFEIIFDFTKSKQKHFRFQNIQ